MRISDALTARSAASLAPQRARAAFRLPAEASAQVRRTAGAAPILGIEATGLVDEVGEKRRRLVRKGRALIDALEGLKLAVLSGRSGAGEMQRLAAESHDVPLSGDPVLDDILGGIRLRAAVELAKGAVRAG